LRRLSSDAFDSTREVILDVPTHLEPNTSFHGSAAIKNYRNNRVEIDARLSDPGILVLTDAFYPGWKVFVGGREQSILRANYLFRGVALPAGNHRVEFIYQPMSFKLGLTISLFTAGLLFVMPLVIWFRRKTCGVDSKTSTCDQPAPLVNE
jgi:uncharacterized membrane protein YfhO